MTTELFILGLISLSIAAMIIVVMTANKEEGISRDRDTPRNGRDLPTKSQDRNRK